MEVDTGDTIMRMQSSTPAQHDVCDSSPGQDLRGQRYAIVGGGVSGLAAAWYLQQRGAHTHIFERDHELGGRAASGQLGERTVTLGGKNIGRKYARFRAFTASLGSHPYEYFGINSSRVIGGRVVRFDSDHRARLMRQLPRVRPIDLARLGRLVQIIRNDPDARYLSQETCGTLTSRYGTRKVHDLFGNHMRELLLRSVTVRLSAAEPDEVPAANVLPYIAMLTDTYEQLAGGIHHVVSAAQARSEVSLGSDVRALQVEQGRVTGLEVTQSNGQRTRNEFDGVVVATPATAAATLLSGLAPKSAALLREVRYFPLVVVLAEYEQPVFNADVRAVVFGPDHELSNAGAYGVEDLNLVRYTFSGRKARALTTDEPDPERLVKLAERTVGSHANVSSNRRRAVIARRFLPGLCAYHPEQGRMLSTLRTLPREISGLALTGDYLRGCSIESCFAASEQAIGELRVTTRHGLLQAVR